MLDLYNSEAEVYCDFAEECYLLFDLYQLLAVPYVILRPLQTSRGLPVICNGALMYTRVHSV